MSAVNLVRSDRRAEFQSGVNQLHHFIHDIFLFLIGNTWDSLGVSPIVLLIVIKFLCEDTHWLLELFDPVIFLFYDLLNSEHWIISFWGWFFEFIDFKINMFGCRFYQFFQDWIIRQCQFEGLNKVLFSMPMLSNSLAIEPNVSSGAVDWSLYAGHLTLQPADSPDIGDRVMTLALPLSDCGAQA